MDKPRPTYRIIDGKPRDPVHIARVELPEANYPDYTGRLDEAILRLQELLNKEPRIEVNPIVHPAEIKVIKDEIKFDLAPIALKLEEVCHCLEAIGKKDFVIQITAPENKIEVLNQVELKLPRSVQIILIILILAIGASFLI
jgi:hypothetical protein